MIGGIIGLAGAGGLALAAFLPWARLSGRHGARVGDVVSVDSREVATTWYGTSDDLAPLAIVLLAAAAACAFLALVVIAGRRGGLVRTLLVVVGLGAAGAAGAALLALQDPEAVFSGLYGSALGTALGAVATITPAAGPFVVLGSGLAVAAGGLGATKRR